MRHGVWSSQAPASQPSGTGLTETQPDQLSAAP